MAYSIEISVSLGGDHEAFERTSKRLRETRAFFQSAGVYALTRATERLKQVTSEDSEARTGALAASLGLGGAENVFDLGDSFVTVGSSLPYAAQLHFGGIIEPKTAKALAIPLHPRLQRERKGPLQLDPTRELLQFVPYTGSKPNVFGLLVDPGDEPVGRQRKRQARIKVGGRGVYGVGPLYALAYWVSQEARPFLFLDEADKQFIVEEFGRHLGVAP